MTAKNASHSATPKPRRPKGEGTIFRRADGRWVARLSFEDPVTGIVKRTQVSGDTKTEVSKALGMLRRRVDEGKPARDDKALFGAYAEAWIGSTLEGSGRAASTKSLYATLLRTHVVGSPLGKTPFNKVTPATVERFVGELRKKGLSDSTVRQIYTVARAVADSAVRDGLVGVNPFAKVTRPRIKDQEKASFLAPGDIDRLLTAAEDSRFGLLFELLLNTGLRRGEALALRWGPDVQEKAGVLRIGGTLSRQGGQLVRAATPKTKESRRDFPITEDVADVLRRIKVRSAQERLRAGSKWVDSGFVFVTELGEPVDPRNALRALKAAADKADLSGVGLHTLRHTAAATMLNGGVEMHVVSKLLGHSSISVTVDIYGHVPTEVTRNAADVLSTAMRAARA